jgi:hypothetical protein
LYYRFPQWLGSRGPRPNLVIGLRNGVHSIRIYKVVSEVGYAGT